MFRLSSQCPLVAIRMMILSTVCRTFLFTNLLVLSAEETSFVSSLAGKLSEMSASVLTSEEKANAPSMLRRDVNRRLREAEQASSAAWQQIKSRKGWEEHRTERLRRLKKSLGNFPQPPKDLNIHISKKIEGEGFYLFNLAYESRPGLRVTANLYTPNKPFEKPSPGILIVHSHHRPKTHGELQDMGMTWARQGCFVLVIDQLGHGERRVHPFVSSNDYHGEFRLSRQDYYFRYDLGVQLHLLGDSLIGWMVWDIIRGVDLLLTQPEIDPEQIILLGSVAGGGDPAAVAAALDNRITAAVPFNFGGPQPESPYPLPTDAENTFRYAGSGSWESTRNLYRSASDGFLPWVVVGSIAPRRLIYGHEFSWDREHDPVWSRLKTIYQYYHADDSLTFTLGRGHLRGKPPEASHCTHIGSVQRVQIHKALAKWYAVDTSLEKEYSARFPEKDLLYQPSKFSPKRKQLGFSTLVTNLAKQRKFKALEKLKSLSISESREHLKSAWSKILGDIEPAVVVKSQLVDTKSFLTSGFSVERIILYPEPKISVTMLLLVPESHKKSSAITVVVSQAGKEKLLKHRSQEIAELIQSGVTVCLPDVRGTGETSPGAYRGRRSSQTALSSSELMLGGTMVGKRLKDLLTVCKYIRSRKDLGKKRIALWGDSLATVNPPETKFTFPRGIDFQTTLSEPLGGMLVLLAGLFEENITTVYVHAGIGSFERVLNGPRVFIPHDVVVPGVIAQGDLAAIAALLAPIPLRMESLVDENNQRLTQDETEKIYSLAAASYKDISSETNFSISQESSSPGKWLTDRMKQN